MRTPPDYIQKEAALIDPLYFCFFNDRRGRWQFRKWNSIQKKRAPYLNSIPIMVVETDDKDFRDLDTRAIRELRSGLINARNAKQLIAEIDRHNEKLVESVDSELDYQFRGAAKDMWRHFKEPKVFLGG